MSSDRHELNEDLEHDGFVTGVLGTYEKLMARKGTVLAVLLAVTAVVLGDFAFIRMGQLKEDRAAVLLGRASAYLDMEQLEQARPLLEKVRADYPGTDAALDALYFLALGDLQQEKLGQARANLESYLKEAGAESFMKSTAQAGLAVCDERERKWAEAADKWTKAAMMDEAGNFNAPVYLLNAALCFEQAGKNADALPLLERILEKYPKSAVKSRVEVVQARLKGDA
jgi:tetratricopeptide (TPR) repeat protein